MKKKRNNSVRAFLLRITLSVALVATAAILLASGFKAQSGSSQSIGETGVAASAIAIKKVAPAVFRGDVRMLPQVPQRELIPPELQEPVSTKHLLPRALVEQPEVPNIPLAPMPAPIQNFPGITRTDTCAGGQCGNGTPPDTNGAVGPNHYIQAVNTAFAIYNKTGTLLASFTENSLWAGSGAPQCDGNAFGDPVVIYDALADRWILTNFAFAGNGSSGPFYQCIAVSKTSDPVAGGWYLYAIQTDTGASGQPPANTIDDYPKFGIWTDCLYFAANGFQMPAGTFNGTEFASFSRSDMYAGMPLTGALGFIANTSDPFTMIPSDLEAPVVGLYNGTPPAGTPNYYVSESQTAFSFEVRKFTAGTNCGGGGSLSAATNVSQTSYTVPGANIVPQPNTTNAVDSLGDRLMQKVQYRKVGSAESLWVVHTTRGGSTATTRPQWAQIDVTGGTIATTPVQQQIYTPDTTIYRWMGSIAADIQGNVALGYSTSNGTSPNFPSIAYSGRLATDTLNMLPQTETQLIAGAGSQTGNCGSSVCHRWGDYSSMSVDPADGCTFWYTTEYYTSQTNGSTTPPVWSTRIGSFKFSTCTTPPVQLTSVHSRMTHTGVGDFNINMPLSGTRGVECRSSTSLGAGNYSIVFTFSNTLSSVGGASASESGCGTIGVGSRTISGSDYIVNLTGVCDAQYVTVTLTNVNDSAHNHSDTVASPQMGFLVGDMNGDGGVDSSDLILVKQQTLQPVNDNAGTSNFREDVNADGSIDSGDLIIVKRQTLNGLPTPP